MAASLGDAFGNAPHDSAQLAVKPTDSSLEGVFANDSTESALVNLNPRGVQPGVTHLARDEKLLGDLCLLFLGVSRDLDDFHPVAQRCGNRVQDICRQN